MKKEQVVLKQIVQKKQWHKPVVVELDIALTQGGTVNGHVESWYAPQGQSYGSQPS